MHGVLAHNLKLEVNWIEAEGLETGDKSYEAQLEGYDGILVPGGFGKRGVEGKIKAIRYARENKVPYLGICLGLQLAVIEYARNRAGLEGAHSTEFDPNTPHPVIAMLDEQTKVTKKGGTMRLGGQECLLKAGSTVREA